MKCIKTCDCTECEMLMINQPLQFIEDKGLYQKSEILVGVKCGNYGQYAETPSKLKDSEQLDDTIWIK